MTTEPPYSEHGGSSRGGSGGDRAPSGIAPVRAFVVLVIFVVAAIALVAVGTRPTVSGNAATPPAPTTTTTTGPSAAPTTTTTTIPHSSVKVVVANATQKNGLAAHYSTVLAAQGWAMQPGIDAATTEATSTVYYAAGQQASAAAIASTLGLKPTAVAALTTAAPVSGVSGDSVVVVAGADLVAGAIARAHMGALPDAFRPLIDDPGHSALFLDFDGTLAAIVADPEAARPWPGVPELLTRLAARFDLVAVVSGRPVEFLRMALGSPPGVRLIGLYGLGQVGPDAAPWAPVMAEVVARARAEAPAGLYVEPKGVTVTLHWRRAPETGPWATAFGALWASERGLRVYPGRMSLELRPPLEVDKGTVVRSLAHGMRAVAVFGDDLGDLPAFVAAEELSAQGISVARVAVVDEESAPEVEAQADLVVQGPAGAVALLDQLAGAVPGQG